MITETILMEILKELKEVSRIMRELNGKM